MVLRLLLVAIFFLILDQFTKMLVTWRLAEGQSAIIASWIRIRQVANARVWLLPHKPRVLLLVWAGLFSGLSLMVWQGYFFQHRAAQLGLGMALGGAGSNIFDQLRHGAVIDFLDLGWWPVFNLADMAITIGVIMALWFLH
jgi:signal peptidase II